MSKEPITFGPFVRNLVIPLPNKTATKHARHFLINLLALFYFAGQSEMIANPGGLYYATPLVLFLDVALDLLALILYKVAFEVPESDYADENIGEYKKIIEETYHRDYLDLSLSITSFLLCLFMMFSSRDLSLLLNSVMLFYYNKFFFYNKLFSIDKNKGKK